MAGDRFGGIKEQQEHPVNFAPGLWLLPSFGNTGVVETPEGLVLVDLPVVSLASGQMQRLRQHLSDPVHTVFLTHGHLDHACALEPLFQEAQEQGKAPPRIIAQRNLLRRLNKYRMLAGYHEAINRTQFQVPEGQPAFPIPTRNPDILFDQSLSTTVGGVEFNAFHAQGETDDALWLWVPDKQTIFAGDLVIWSFPNVGNPFKVQRYTLEWAQALEAMAAKEPEFLVPGHGPLLQGRKKIGRTLHKVAAALRYLHQEVIDRLNAGMWYEDILHEVSLPPEMMDQDFLAPRYGCPSFVVHGILRQYTGWYDGNPSNLFPPKKAEVAREVVELVGCERLLERARRLAEQGGEAMALQLLDMVLAGDLDGEARGAVHQFKGEMLKILGKREKCFIAWSIYRQGAWTEQKAAQLQGGDT